MGKERSVSMRLTGLAPNAFFLLERMGREDTALYLWEQMGGPANLSPAQEAALRAAEPAREERRADGKGVLTIELTLRPWGIVCLRQTDE